MAQAGGASYNSSTTKLATTDNLSYRMFQQGGVPPQVRALIQKTEGKPFFDVNTIIPSPDNLLINPTAFKVDVIPYALISDAKLPKDFAASPNELFEVGDYYIVLRDLYNVANGIVQIASTSATEIEKSDYQKAMIMLFGGGKQLQEVQDQIQLDMMFLESLMKECYSPARKNCHLSCPVNEAVIENIDREITRNADREGEIKNIQLSLEAVDEKRKIEHRQSRRT